jgi:hypothetical protein
MLITSSRAITDFQNSAVRRHDPLSLLRHFYVDNPEAESTKHDSRFPVDMRPGVLDCTIRQRRSTLFVLLGAFYFSGGP